MDLAGCGAADSIPVVHHHCRVCQGCSRHSTGAYVCPLPILFNVIHTKWGFNLFLRQEEFVQLVAYSQDALDIGEVNGRGNFPLLSWGRLSSL